MKIQNIITQPQLEMLLRLANAMHSGNPAWRYGQSVFNAAQTILPDLAEEIRGKFTLDPYSWPEDHGARWTQWYAAVCPDESREEFNMEYTDEDTQQLDNATEKALELRGDKHSITYPTHSSFRLK